MMKQRQFSLYFWIFILICCSCNNTSSDNSSLKNEEQTQQEDELVEVEEKVEEDCPDCDGNGYILNACPSCGGLGETYHHESGFKPKQCQKCMGTGITRCNRCDGCGSIRCEGCNGNGNNKCPSCHGYGKLITYDLQHPWNCPDCPQCNASGYIKCVLCNGKGRLRCCGNGLGTCTQCWGTGIYGKEEYSYSETKDCSNCNGTGSIRDMCWNCQGSGKIFIIKTVMKHKSELNE